jgi:hypothetical protein
MEPQVWSGTEKPKPALVKKIRPNKHHFGKPGGGLWTSPYRKGTSPWIEYAKSIGLSGIEDEEQWVLKPKSGADILEISDRKDLLRVETKKIDGHPTLNYETIFEHYNAIHVTESMVSYPQFQEWGCESVLWSDWIFESVISLDEYM